MRVIIYTRVSHDRFGDERSPERQEAACRAFADAREWVVVGAHRDVDVSAYKEIHRPGYDQLLADVDAARCDAVCVWKLDRLVRRPREFEAFWERCERTGVALVSVTEPIDTSTELGLAIVRVLVTFAGLESATKSLRLKAAFREVALKGEPHVLRRVFGLTEDWSAIIPDEAALVREAATRVLAGETLAAVVCDWTLRGLRTPRGALWTVHRLRDLLLSPRLWGQRTYHGEVVAIGRWPAILTPEDGARLQYLLADPSRRREPLDGRRSLLTGLLRCGNCGSTMVTRKSTRGDPTYCCPSAPRGCNGVSVRQAPADDVVKDAALDELERRRDHVPEVVAAVPSGALLDAVRRHVQALREAADDFYLHKTIDRATFLSVRDSIDCSLHTETMGEPVLSIPERFGGLCVDPRSAWPTLSQADRRAALGFVVDHVVIHPAPRGGGRFRPERVEVVFPGQRSTRPARARADDEIRSDALLGTAEVAVALGVCTVTVHRMLRKGDLPGYKADGQWLVRGADVVACRELRRLAGVKRVRRSSRKFAEILRAYNSTSGQSRVGA